MLASAVVLVPLAGAVIPYLLRRAGHATCAGAAAVVSLTALALLMTHAPAVVSEEPIGTRLAWVPQLGLSFSFYIDGLGLFFAVLILGMGLLVILYARYYLDNSEPVGRFYAVLLVFQGAMLGITLSDNILLLLVFWELTSLSSFLLIGHWSHRPESRQGARMALIVTGGGGLALIGAMLILGDIAGSYEMSDILKRGVEVRAHPLAPVALALVLVGAFTKSAQIPFHFWLPNAMAAPTPVSAYLHSATMVKAGIFLLARLWPVFSPMEMWVAVVSIVGLGTMLIAALIALFKRDLKLLLAYSTVSHLGLIVMLLGLGTPAAVVAAMFHILNHALFKAALFMCAGIVDHEAGSRNLDRIGGLARLMPITAALATVAAASMAGVPLLSGFVSKEMMLEQAFAMQYAGLPWLFGLAAALAACLSVGYSARLVHGTFMGAARHPDDAHPHDPKAGMWLPVAILVVPVVAIGVLPSLAAPIVEMTARAIVGGDLPPVRLYLWHGVTVALAASALALVGGVFIVRFMDVVEALRDMCGRPNATRAFNEGLVGFEAGARAFLDRLDSHSLPRYVAASLVAVLTLGTYAFLGGTHGPGHRALLAPGLPATAGWIVLVAASAVAVLKSHDRLLLIVMTAAAGFIVSLAFLQFSAPDLALTQISIEVVTTILMLLALNLMPKVAADVTSLPRKAINGAIAIASGAAVGALALAVMSRGYQSISDFHLAQAKPGGGGTNVVNVILVDFRAFDTLGEIMVLGIAGIAIYALLDSALGGRAGQRLEHVRPRTQAGSAQSLIVTVSTRILLPLVLTAGVFIFLRGHNEPGGGFIAGVVIGVAYIMQYIASGYRWSQQRARFDAHLMIGAGIALAAASGLPSWTFGYPYLTSTFTYLPIPLIGPVEIASVVLFDIGVLFAVVGMVLISLANLSRVEEPAVESRPGPQKEARPGGAVAPQVARHPQPQEAD
ncbi:MAG: monovalent cation/H+ antiporter subunit A [Hyphomicrobiaceae bacterium]